HRVCRDSVTQASGYARLTGQPRQGIFASAPATIGSGSRQDWPMKSGVPWTQRSRTYRKGLRMHCCTVKILKLKSHTETAGGANGATPLVLRESSTMSNANTMRLNLIRL